LRDFAAERGLFYTEQRGKMGVVFLFQGNSDEIFYRTFNRIPRFFVFFFTEQSGGRRDKSCGKAVVGRNGSNTGKGLADSETGTNALGGFRDL
jgi:hypothetical protein